MPCLFFLHSLWSTLPALLCTRLTIDSASLASPSITSRNLCEVRSTPIIRDERITVHHWPNQSQCYLHHPTWTIASIFPLYLWFLYALTLNCSSYAGEIGLFYHLDKTTVLQEARAFNDSPINARKCRLLLTKIIYLLYLGEPFNTKEATELFFNVTKLFQSKDVRSTREMKRYDISRTYWLTYKLLLC